MALHRDSNITLQSLALLENWSHEVGILVKNDDIVTDHQIEIFVTNASLKKKDQVIDHDEYTYMEANIIKAVDAVLHEDKAEGLAINGLTPKQIFISKEDLEPIEDEVDSILMMLAVSDEAINKQWAFQLLANKCFYMIGELPKRQSDENERNDRMDIIVRDGYESVRLFLNKERANRFNQDQQAIHKYRFLSMAHSLRGSYGITIEPHEGYGLAYSPEELDEEFQSILS